MMPKVQLKQTEITLTELIEVRDALPYATANLAIQPKENMMLQDDKNALIQQVAKAQGIIEKLINHLEEDL